MKRRYIKQVILFLAAASILGCANAPPKEIPQADDAQYRASGDVVVPPTSMDPQVP